MNERNSKGKVSILSVRIDNYTIKDITEKIKSFVCEKSNLCNYVFVANLNHIKKIHKDYLLKKVYEKASLVVPDGRYVYWLSKILGTPLKEYIRGLDLFYSLCKLSEVEGYKTLMVGGKPGSVEKAKLILQKKYPKLKILKTLYYPLGSIEVHKSLNEEIIYLINKLDVDILFLGLGTPREQQWIAKYRERIKCVVVGVGSVYDFIAGNIKEAPKLLQVIGLEWLWRLLSEPTRLWKRYLIENITLIFDVLNEMFKKFIKKD